MSDYEDLMRLAGVEDYNDDELVDYIKDMYQRILNCDRENGEWCWVSAGGTANVMAGRISRKFHIPFEEAYQEMNRILTRNFGEDWYEEMSWANGAADSINKAKLSINSNPDEPLFVPFNDEEDFDEIDYFEESLDPELNEYTNIRLEQRGNGYIVYDTNNNLIAGIEKINGGNWRPGMPKDGYCVRYHMSDRFGWQRMKTVQTEDEAIKFVQSLAGV